MAMVLRSRSPATSKSAGTGLIAQSNELAYGGLDVEPLLKRMK
jgi:hypothetical protein